MSAFKTFAMAIFEIEKFVSIENLDSPITISVSHKAIIGTDSYHIIDIPDNDSYYDHEWRNEGSVILGKGSKFVGKNIVIYSKAYNVNPKIDSVVLDYLVNNILCYEHSSAKEVDDTPAIKLTIHFKA